MIKRPLRNLTAASILAGATHGAIAQAPMPQTPTTKILAVGTFACWYRLFRANWHWNDMVRSAPALGASP